MRNVETEQTHYWVRRFLPKGSKFTIIIFQTFNVNLFNIDVSKIILTLAMSEYITYLHGCQGMTRIVQKSILW